jgi:hydrogenase expression/formation protein HypE
MRDLTRGGLTSALNELAQARRLSMPIEEARIPVSETVRGACELLGLDLLFVANEGRFAVFVPAAQTKKSLDVLRAFDVSREASRIGEVLHEADARVYVKSVAGGERILQMLSGEQLAADMLDPRARLHQEVGGAPRQRLPAPESDKSPAST